MSADIMKDLMTRPTKELSVMHDTLCLRIQELKTMTPEVTPELIESMIGHANLIHSVLTVAVNAELRKQQNRNKH